MLIRLALYLRLAISTLRLYYPETAGSADCGWFK